MRDFYAVSAPMPLLDQAEGLRQMFADRAGARQVLALAANAHVTHSALALDRLAAGLSRLGRQVLVVDAADSAPPPHELSRLELTAGVELLRPGVAYLPARGLPLQFVDARGSAARFVEALFEAVPSADVVLLHAEAGDLARALARRVARPLLLAADHPESLKQAYASCKLLKQRTGLATFDLILLASARSPRIAGIVNSLRGTADGFIGALVGQWALIDPAAPAQPLDGALAVAAGRDADAPDARLQALLAAQLALDPADGAAGVPPPPLPHALPQGDPRPTTDQG
ncbi:MAG: flagellar biosynthesis protein [Rubrivivax sp.]|nr:flagellar biosynthesis protein [Rubrivivax sp.]